MAETLLERIKVRWPRIRWVLRQITHLSPAKGDVYYGNTAEFYEAERSKTGRWKAEQRTVERYLGILPDGLKQLDVPEGTGRFLVLYKAHGHSVTGLDSSVDMIGFARRRAGEEGYEFIQGSATSLPFPDGTFDLVVSTRFLRHILTYRDARRALAEMARVTRGHAIIELGGNDLFSVPLREGKPMRDRMKLEDVRSMLAANGFEIVEETVTHRRRPRLRRCTFLLRRRPA